ncbi:MAG: transglutaminase domain-containing protein, partial [Acidobacteriota bacterium]
MVADIEEKASPAPQVEHGKQGEESRLSAERLEKLFDSLEASSKEIPRDSFDAEDVVRNVGQDAKKLFIWVRDNTSWVPYQGVLRGPTGVLMDRLGNSLDRALLLAELLRISGQEVRLARGTIGEEKARQILGEILQRPLHTKEEIAGETKRPLSEQPIEQESGEEISKEALEAAVSEAKQSVERVIQAVEEQLKILSALVREPSRKEMVLQEEELAAIGDHWWVEMRDGETWVDLDPLTHAAEFGKTLTAPAEVVSPDHLSEELFHSIKIRVVVERWHEGKLSEQLAFEETTRPAKLCGQRIALSCIPLNWPEGTEDRKEGESVEEFQAKAVAQKEWLPVLEIGEKLTAQASFTDTGDINLKPDVGDMNKKGRDLGDLGFMLGGGEEEEPQKEGELTAAWIEFELNSPGAVPQKIRREL